jgi:hypothetical protein
MCKALVRFNLAASNRFAKSPVSDCYYDRHSGSAGRVTVAGLGLIIAELALASPGKCLPLLRWSLLPSFGLSVFICMRRWRL